MSKVLNLFDYKKEKKDPKIEFEEFLETFEWQTVMEKNKANEERIRRQRDEYNKRVKESLKLK